MRLCSGGNPPAKTNCLHIRGREGTPREAALRAPGQPGCRRGKQPCTLHRHFDLTDPKFFYLNVQYSEIFRIHD